MTEENNTSDPDKNPEEGVYSLDDIDQLLQEEDPEFSETLSQISKDKDIQGAHIDDSAEIIEDVVVSEDLNKQSFKEKLLQKAKNFFIYFIDSIYNGAIGLKSGALNSFAWIKIKLQGLVVFLKTGLPERVKYYKVAVGQRYKSFTLFFKNLTFLKKIVFACMPFILFGLGFLIYKSFLGNLLPQIYKPYLSSFSTVADKVYSYDPKVDMRPFQRAFPQREFTVQLSKVVVNLKTSSSSGSTPMGYFELYVGTNTQQSTVEIKDRENEFLDIVQRTAEKFSYQDLSQLRGKDQFKEMVAQKMNEALTVGNITNVYFKEIIIKP